MKLGNTILAPVILAIISIANIHFKSTEKVGPTSYYGVFHTIPISDIKPSGWLKEILVRQKNGLGLHHAESGYPYNTCLWAGQIPKGGNPQGQSWWPYEQSGYLVDGLYRCGLALGDTSLINLGQRNIDFVLANPRPDGELGLPIIGNTQWPFSVFVRAMMANYDETQDPAILNALTQHFLSLHNDNWDDRDVCIIESMCWTYNYTGDTRLLAKAEHIWDNFVTNKRKSSTVFQSTHMIAADSVYGHGVTIAEIGKQPAILYLYTGKNEYKESAERFFNAVFRDHMLVDGIPSSSEALAGKKAEGQHETCDISDYTWSMGYLLMATGNAEWGDKIERGIFNAGFGAISKDFKSHEYFSSPNQVFATQESSIAGRQRQAWHNRAAYRPGFDTECCSGNVHRIFPNYLSRLWLKDNNFGIAAALYAPNTLKTKIGAEQKTATITEETEYPFFGKITFRINIAEATQFPFSMRIPAWAKGAIIIVNKEKAITVIPGTFYTINRVFKNGDSITLSLPMQVKAENPVANGISLTRGPLLFALNIKENAKSITGQFKTSLEYPAWDINPASPWNYCLSLNNQSVDKKVKVITKPLKGFPFDPGNSPVKLLVPAKLIPAWTATTVMPGLPSPGFIASVAKPVELIPEGSTRIRLSIFPDDRK